LQLPGFLYKNIMQNNSHIQVTANGIVDLTTGTGHVPETTTLLDSFFDKSSFENSEEILSDLLQMYINPDPSSTCSEKHLSNVVYAVRNITNLLRKLESVNNQVKGGAPC
jgi:hypothetical protein